MKIRKEPINLKDPHLNLKSLQENTYYYFNFSSIIFFTLPYPKFIAIFFVSFAVFVKNSHSNFSSILCNFYFCFASFIHGLNFLKLIVTYYFYDYPPKIIETLKNLY